MSEQAMPQTRFVTLEPEQAQPHRFALFDYGFRPFFLFAACYAALAAAPGSPQAADRSALAAQLQQRLGWQQGSAALLAMLLAPGSPPD